MYGKHGVNNSNRDARYHMMVGGYDPNKIWTTYTEKHGLLKIIESDKSVERMGFLTGDGKPNMDAIKKMFIDSDPSQNKKYLSWIIDGYIKS